MAGKPKIEEKYERNGWPAIKRPDVKPPEGWSLELVAAGENLKLKDRSAEEQSKDAQSGGVRAGTGTP